VDRVKAISPQPALRPVAVEIQAERKRLSLADKARGVDEVRRSDEVERSSLVVRSSAAPVLAPLRRGPQVIHVELLGVVPAWHPVPLF
jgi:hypothetical protein